MAAADLVRDVSWLWHNGGTGSTSAHQVASSISWCFSGVAAVLNDDGRHAGHLQRWLFFISDSEQRRCMQLHGKPKEVAYSRPTPARPQQQRSSNRQRLEAEERAARMLTIEASRRKTAETAAGTDKARDILSLNPNHFASRPLLQYIVPDGSTVHFHMWRCDVVEAFRSQRSLRTASVPFRVWRRMRLTYLHLSSNPGPWDVPSCDVLAGLLCWHCGEKAATLRQCSCCRRAHYCSPGCQHANWASAHKRWCRRMRASKEAMRCAAPAEQQETTREYAWTSADGDAFDDFVAALHRNPQVAAMADTTWLSR